MSVESSKNPFDIAKNAVNDNKVNQKINTILKNNDDSSTANQQNPYLPATLPVKEKLTEKDDNEKVKEKDAVMSDEFNNTSYKLGKIEAELETHKAGQARLEASIAKLAETAEGLSENISKKLETKIDDKFKIIEAKFETVNSKVSILMWLIPLLFGVVYFMIGINNNHLSEKYSSVDKKIENLENDLHKWQPQVQMPITTKLYDNKSQIQQQNIAPFTIPQSEKKEQQ
jgi:predicted nuclease with TOPRIM domain